MEERRGIAMVEHARLKRRAFHAPSIVLGEGPERVRFSPGEGFPVPAREERDVAVPPRRDPRGE